MTKKTELNNSVKKTSYFFNLAYTKINFLSQQVEPKYRDVQKDTGEKQQLKN